MLSLDFDDQNTASTGESALITTTSAAVSGASASTSDNANLVVKTTISKDNVKGKQSENIRKLCNLMFKQAVVHVKAITQGKVPEDPSVPSLDFSPLDGPDVLENFDFDSFLHTEDNSAFGSLGNDFNFGSGEAANQHFALDKQSPVEPKLLKPQADSDISLEGHRENLTTQLTTELAAKLTPVIKTSFTSTPGSASPSVLARVPNQALQTSNLGMATTVHSLDRTLKRPLINSHLHRHSRTSFTDIDSDTPPAKRARMLDKQDNPTTIDNQDLDEDSEAYSVAGSEISDVTEQYINETCSDSIPAGPEDIREFSFDLGTAGNRFNMIETLKNEIKTLRQGNATLLRKQLVHIPEGWVTLHRVLCRNGRVSTTYTDLPTWRTFANGTSHLEGQFVVSNVPLFKEQKASKAFVVWQDYICDRHDRSRKKKKETQGANSEKQIPMDKPPEHNSVSISILSQILGEGLDYLSDAISNKYWKWPDFSCDFAPPTMLVHYEGKRIEDHVAKMDEKEQIPMRSFLSYVSQYYSAQSKIAAANFAVGLFSVRDLEYLFVPGMVMIQQVDGHELGCLQTSPLLLQGPQHDVNEWNSRDFNRFKLEAERWGFDGEYFKEQVSLYLNYEGKNKPEMTILKINKLNIYPIQFARQEVRQRLEQRGETHWNCRFHAYVNVNGSDYHHDEKFQNSRFMIDMVTYKKLHGKQQGPAQFMPVSKSPTRLSENKMKNEKPPSDDFFYLLPANTYGFHMVEKRWVNLRVDSITPVEWNFDAFNTIAMDDDDKHLVKALVSTKLDDERRTDVIEGKGNGLVILLHGGPGTGKTITAEGVAEIAKKPLYRVTCGDIGTDAEKVEEYLETVFHLGKIWDCVVLLDEADVFLEQRSLANLQRNALVSVFLRVLEYYEGILILTSNRVGIFDEAFKSRIQLALHYRSLDHSKRHQIWSNFITRLEKLNEKADFVEIRSQVDKLASYPMNGRQIRNAFSTARQLALFEKKTMNSRDLEHVIRVAQKFENYLLEVKDLVGDDDWARERGDR